MREILFRGKRADNGEWVFGYYGVFKPTHQIFVPFTAEEEKENEGHFLSAIGGLWFIVIPETVGQYTGQTDSNGKKIFEGDIMRNAGNVVEFGVDSFCINGDCPLSLWTKTAIIGNIYDNPELLKGGC